MNKNFAERTAKSYGKSLGSISDYFLNFGKAENQLSEDRVKAYYANLEAINAIERDAQQKQMLGTYRVASMKIQDLKQRGMASMLGDILSGIINAGSIYLQRKQSKGYMDKLNQMLYGNGFHGNSVLSDDLYAGRSGWQV